MRPIHALLITAGTLCLLSAPLLAGPFGFRKAAAPPPAPTPAPAAEPDATPTPASGSIRAFCIGEGNFLKAFPHLKEASLDTVTPADYARALQFEKQEREYANTVITGFPWKSPAYSRAVDLILKLYSEAGFKNIILTLNTEPQMNEIWNLPKPQRMAFFQKIRDLKHYDRITTIAAVDEPYLDKPVYWNWSYKKLQGAIQEVREAFPGKKIMVVFNDAHLDRGIPPGIDIVQSDFYPWYMGDKVCNSESAWKREVQRALSALRSKMAPHQQLCYVAQGFHGEQFGRGGKKLRDAPCNADTIRWSFEAAEQAGCVGISYYKNRGVSSYEGVVFTHLMEPGNESAFAEFKRLGKLVLSREKAN
ncbi:MAG: hypothetical protein K8T26_03750 [Lentisphaerae bacterium]|nr:hypothetical protein [Lentisphaerota bacterium]